ncbi:T9SS type B sorting domain-containing protein, partial [Flavobacterium sp.]
GGCTSGASAAFTNLARLTAPAIPTVSISAPTCAADGVTTITNYNAANTYTFSPAGPTAGAGGSITGAAIGTAYTITATNGGCTSGASASFTNLMMLVTPPVPTIINAPPTCFTDGVTTITNYNAANNYAFAPIGPTVGSGGIVTNVIPGTPYTVVSTNGGCTSNTVSFTNAPRLFNVNIANPAPLHFCDDNNDGFGQFNLTSLIPVIIGGSPYLVSFHETTTDAAIGGTTISNPSSYNSININTQTIYIRIQSNTSTCFVVVPLQLIVDRSPEANEPNDYRLCDADGDGQASFDLTLVAPQVLGSLNPATHTISYYTSSTDAQSETAAITTLLSYLSGTNTLFIRVENNATGCSDIVPLELIVNPIPLATQPNYPRYSLCDTTIPLAHEEFDLGSKINSILLGQTGMNVTFHFNQSDADNDINPLPLLYTNVAPFLQTIWIRIENNATNCYVLSTMDIRVEPLPSPIPPNQAYAVCDNNQDGFGTFNLNSLTNAILQGGNYTITYHETNGDAQQGDNPLSSPYTNIIPFTQFIYALAVDNVNGCQAVIPIELQVKPQPMEPINVRDLTLCDQDANPQDFSTAFNLTTNDAEVLSIQPSPASNYTVTYHVLQGDAISGNAPIFQSANHIGSNHDIIWVRVEDNNTGCFAIGSFELLVNAPLALPTPTPLSICDSDPLDQFAVFDLTIKNSEIIGSANATIIYYPDHPVTTSSVAIATPNAYQNYIPGVQTLGVMVTTSAGCPSYTTLDIRVMPIPSPNLNGVFPLMPQCDVNNTGDMMEVFDLTANAAAIINGDLTLTLHYYREYNDAVTDTNEILNPTTALVGQNVWIRVENTQLDYLGNNCYVIVEQPLTVNPLPPTIPASVVENCDDDADGQATFDLTATATAFYGSADVTINYYTSFLDAQNDIGAITTPNAYENITNPQIVYVRVVDNVTGCVNFSGQFTLTVNPKPTATTPAGFETCDTDGTNDGFFALDLGSYINGIIGTQTGVTVTFYDTQTDAINQTDAVTDLANYQTYTHIIWVRIENDITGCYELVSFESTVEKLPEPIITAPSDVLCVEFGTNILLSGLTLDSGITSPDYTFEWFEAANPSLILGTDATYAITSVAPGTYTVVATSINPPLQGCASDLMLPSASYVVSQTGPPQFGTPAFTVSNYFDENQIITVNVAGFGIYEFSLDDGPFQSSNIFEHVPMGSHSITVRDATGITSCGEISIDGVQTIDYPHYFTPNGDGYNDTWNVRGLNQLNARLYIFDRYGKLLKQISTSGTSEGWDGTFNGHPLPSTDYWFRIEYMEQSVKKEFKAHFSLKR